MSTEAPASDFLTCSEIAERIAKTRGSCNRASVWRVIQRLKIEPSLRVGRYSVYSPADAETIAAAMKNYKVSEKGE